MKQYNRLNMTEREEISRYLALNHSIRWIALALGRSASTVSREIRRVNMTKPTYRASKAHQNAQQMALIRKKPLKLETNDRLLNYVTHHLQDHWSPEQIAKSLFFEYPNDMSMHISAETIYAYLYVRPRGLLKKRLVAFLRQRHKNRRSIGKKRKATNPIQDYISIDLRPPEVDARKVPGHWEGDLIMGAMNRSAIGTLVERTTRFTILVKLENKDSASVCQAFARHLNQLPPEFKKTLTHDQGQEMTEHALITQRTEVKVYLAHPHSPWERGTNENTNMLVRDYYPKGTDFSKITEEDLKKTQDSLNGRPRKVLNWHKPVEVFNELLR
jgi:IS30 family transposase